MKTHFSTIFTAFFRDLLFLYTRNPLCESQTTVSCREDTDGVGLCFAKLRPGQCRNIQTKAHSDGRFSLFFIYLVEPIIMECFVEHLCVFSALNSTTLPFIYPNNENHICTLIWQTLLQCYTKPSAYLTRVNFLITSLLRGDGTGEGQGWII